MSENYGMMVGWETAIKWIENLKGVDTKIQDCVINRMKYEFAKDIAVKPRFNKGKYGHKYDSFSCGKCGSGINEAWYEFCPRCGFRIGKREYEASGR